MNPYNIYEEYSKTLNRLTELQGEYRISSPDPAIQTGIQQKIRECQANLTRIIEDMIQSNPFLNTKRTGQGVLNE